MAPIDPAEHSFFNLHFHGAGLVCNGPLVGFTFSSSSLLLLPWPLHALKVVTSQHLRMDLTLSPQRKTSADPSLTDWVFIPAVAKSSGLLGSPLPIPQAGNFPNRPKSRGPQLHVGGLQIPTPKVRSKSLQTPVPPVEPSVGQMRRPTHVLHSHLQSAHGNHIKTTQTGVFKDQSSQANSSQLLRLRCLSQSTWLVQEWQAILQDLGQDSSVWQALDKSEHAGAHAARLLDQFAPST